MSKLSDARGEFVHVASALVRSEHGRCQVLAEARQLLVDLMDLLEQEPEERPIIAPYEAFERAQAEKEKEGE